MVENMKYLVSKLWMVNFKKHTSCITGMCEKNVH